MLDEQYIDFIKALQNVITEQRKMISKSGDGKVAPPDCWIETHQVPTNGKVYDYKRVRAKKPIFDGYDGNKTFLISLGKPGSDLHLQWERMIKRRDLIKRLEGRTAYAQHMLNGELNKPLLDLETRELLGITEELIEKNNAYNQDKNNNLNPSDINTEFQSKVKNLNKEDCKYSTTLGDDPYEDVDWGDVNTFPDDDSYDKG